MNEKIKDLNKRSRDLRTQAADFSEQSKGWGTRKNRLTSGRLSSRVQELYDAWENRGEPVPGREAGGVAGPPPPATDTAGRILTDPAVASTGVPALVNPETGLPMETFARLGADFGEDTPPTAETTAPPAEATAPSTEGLFDRPPSILERMKADEKSPESLLVPGPGEPGFSNLPPGHQEQSRLEEQQRQALKENIGVRLPQPSVGNEMAKNMEKHGMAYTVDESTGMGSGSELKPKHIDLFVNTLDNAMHSNYREHHGEDSANPSLIHGGYWTKTALGTIERDIVNVFDVLRPNQITNVTFKQFIDSRQLRLGPRHGST